MKKIIISAATIAFLASCSNTKDASTSSNSSSMAKMAATQLLTNLAQNATLEDVANLFGVMDSNNDNSISKDEAVGDVSTNFDALDSDSDGGINLSELGGLLSFLK